MWYLHNIYLTKLTKQICNLRRLQTVYSVQLDYRLAQAPGVVAKPFTQQIVQQIEQPGSFERARRVFLTAQPGITAERSPVKVRRLECLLRGFILFFCIQPAMSANGTLNSSENKCLRYVPTWNVFKKSSRQYKFQTTLRTHRARRRGNYNIYLCMMQLEYGIQLIPWFDVMRCKQ